MNAIRTALNLAAFVILPSLASAQFGTITVDVDCTSQTMTDTEWHLTVVVTDPAGSDHTVVVNAPNHADAKMMTASMAKKLNALLKLKAPRFEFGETTNETGEVSERTAEDCTAPANYMFKSVTTEKNKPDEQGNPNYVKADDHVKIFAGDTKIN